ncbi:hypothetical protein JC525_09180 [Alteromonas sp. IB21]|uniref:hypothetical protein n=1 Tax=Alteromonas sp. IB21 TaxID=2779369 RepID=UPI0018E6F32F|nr:hypothetical protein [Alteromonas sp. IB21]MBJ2129109.1 hypothetical protein [Alteromonas sp. IB21]
MGSEHETKNLEFWKRYSKTDSNFVKKGKVSGQNRTMVDAQYKKMNITRAFGMYGKGWGVVAGTEDYDRTHFSNETCILHYRATAFYVFGGERFELPIASSIKEAYITDGGQGYLRIDDEAVKKVRTDAITKAFTDIGFNADIHMGLFDDQDYVRGVNAQYEIEKSEEKEAELKQQITEFNDWMAAEVEAAQKVSSPASFQAVMRKLSKKAQTRCDAMGINPKKYLERIEVLIKERFAQEEQQNAS